MPVRLPAGEAEAVRRGALYALHLRPNTIIRHRSSVTAAISAANKPPHDNAHCGECCAQKDRQDEFVSQAAHKRDDAIQISRGNSGENYGRHGHHAGYEYYTSNTGANLVEAAEGTLYRIRIKKCTQTFARTCVVFSVAIREHATSLA